MKQAASLNRVKLAYGNCWKMIITKIRTFLRLPEKKDFSVLHCFLRVLKKKIFVCGAAVRYLTLPQGKHELLLSLCLLGLNRSLNNVLV